VAFTSGVKIISAILGPFVVRPQIFINTKHLTGKQARTGGNNTSVRAAPQKDRLRFPQNFPQPANPHFMRIYRLTLVGA
jgi:hypothetical protein